MAGRSTHPAPSAPVGPPGGRREWLLFLVPLALAAGCWASIRRNWFYYDDFHHLFTIADGRLGEFLLQPFGGHMLVLRNAVFALFWLVFGPRPERYFLVVLATHLLNVALCFALVRRLTRSARLACAGAALYGTTPLLAETLGWYSVYGQTLATTLLAAVLVDVAAVSPGNAPVGTRRVALWCSAMVAASLCFGTGMASALAFPLVVLLAIAPPRLPPGARVLLAALPLLVAGLWALIQWHQLRSDPAPETSRAVLVGLWTDWRSIAALLLHLVTIGLGSLPLLDLAIASPYPGVLLLTSAVAHAAVLAGGLLVARSEHRRWILALVALAGATWGAVAFGRGAMAGGSFGEAVMARLPRYQSGSMLPLTAALCVALGALYDRFAPAAWVGSPARRDGLLAAALAGLVAVRLGFGKPIDHFDEARLATELTRRQIQEAIDRAPAGAVVRIRNGLFPLPIFERGRFPGTAGIFVIFYAGDTVDGRTVRFVARDDLVRAARARGGRLAGLLESESEGTPRSDPRPVDASPEPFPPTLPGDPRSVPVPGPARS